MRGDDSNGSGPVQCLVGADTNLINKLFLQAGVESGGQWLGVQYRGMKYFYPNLIWFYFTSKVNIIIKMSNTIYLEEFKR